MDRDVYERMAESQAAHWWFSARRRIISSVIQHLDLQQGAEILEAGCGPGGNLQMLQQHGTVYAMEPDSSSVDFAQSIGCATVQSGFLPDAIPFEDKQFDLIVALDVLEHVQADAEAVRALLHRVKPQGNLLVTVPAFQFLWSAHDDHHHHQRRYSPKTLRDLFQLDGIDVQWVTCFNTWLFPLIFTVRMLKRLLGLRDSPDDAMPGAVLNRLLLGIFASERFVVGRVHLPVGTSVMLLARKSN